MRDNADSHSNVDELYKSFDVIVKYYDISSENKEEILKKISEFLFEKAFPKGNLSLISYDIRFYNAIVVFNDKLEQLVTIHNEAYIHTLISKHKQVIETIELKNERKREYIEFKNEKIRKYNEEEKRKKHIEIEKEKEKYIQEIKTILQKLKVIKIIALLWMLFVLIVEIICIIEDKTIWLSCLFGFFIWGVVPRLIINFICKIKERKLKIEDSK